MYLTVQEVANRLRISLSSGYALIETGKLAHHRVGARNGAIRISEEDLARFLTERRSEPKNQRSSAPSVGRVKLKHIQL